METTDIEEPTNLTETNDLPQINIGPEIYSEETHRDISKDDSEVQLSDPTFPYLPSFASKSRKEKEQIFLRAFEQQVDFVRNKELRSDSCLGLPLSALGELDPIIQTRTKYIDELAMKQQKIYITSRETTSSSVPAPRVDVKTTPTFDPKLNVNFDTQISLMDRFKDVVSKLLVSQRVKVRCQQVLQRLFSRGQNLANAPVLVHEDEGTTPESLLTVEVVCSRKVPKFSQPYIVDAPESLPCVLEPNKIERPFHFYKPDLVERFRLTSFNRTDISTFVPAHIAQPTEFPVVPEEQPIRERSEPILPDDSLVNRLKPSDLVSVMPLPSVNQYHRDIRYFDFDPISILQPQPLDLPPLDDEVGKASILSLSDDEYRKMSLYSKVNTPVAPFLFTGIPVYKFSPLSGPDEDDLRELGNDDDVDNLDIIPKPRAITDFMSKPPSEVNKSHMIAESVAEGQSQWLARQKNGAKDLLDRLEAINGLMRDKSLKLETSDLVEFLHQ